MIKLFKNGNIRTMDHTIPKADTIIVKENKFVYVGFESGANEYLKLNGPADQEVDLNGKLVLPGFNDSHMHFMHYAETLLTVDLKGTESIDEIKIRLKKAVDSRSEDDVSWLEGEGWNHDYFKDEKRFLNKFDLNEVSKEIPMLVTRICCHVGVLNTPALKALNITKETAHRYGDLIELLPNGEPNGVIKESLLANTKAKILSLTFDITNDTTKKIIKKAQYQALKQGLTSIQSDDFGYVPNNDYDSFFNVIRDLDENEDLKIRIGEQCYFNNKQKVQKFFDDGYYFGWGNDKYRVNCIKIVSDGSLGARTAALRQPYNDDSSTKGSLLFKQEELDEIVRISHSRGCPIAIHAIGDAAIEMALNSIEKAQKIYPKQDLRHGIVHCQITDEDLLNRFKELNVLAFVQPIFIDYDMNIVKERVGEELAKTSYAWKTMIDRGIHVSFGTDCPVESINTMPNIYSAVTRKSITGNSKKVYLSNEKLTMEEAIYAYTAEGAYASNEEDIKGTISEGKLADFIVLDRDLFNLNSDEEILHTKVLKTYVDGALVYER